MTRNSYLLTRMPRILRETIISPCTSLPSISLNLKISPQLVISYGLLAIRTTSFISRPQRIKLPRYNEMRDVSIFITYVGVTTTARDLWIFIAKVCAMTSIRGHSTVKG